jgi:hypothetical protein
MAGLKIEAVDVFYLAMPRIEDIGDGSQDACVVRVAAGGHQLGRCEYRRLRRSRSRAEVYSAASSKTDE